MIVRITNEALWNAALRGEDIDGWLRENVGFGGWAEKVGLQMRPYRTFDIHDEELATLFLLRWK